MKNIENNEWIMHLSLPATRPLDLLGKQSVRATFKLSRACIDTIDIVAAQLNIKKKSLFDHLAEDVDSLKTIASKVKEQADDREGRIQKTYVISRKSIEALSRISRVYGTPRDFLVEYSVQRLMPIVHLEKKRHRLRKTFLKDLESHYFRGQQLMKKMAGRLKPDDPMLQMYRLSMEAYESQFTAMRDLVAQGEVIEQLAYDA